MKKFMVGVLIIFFAFSKILFAGFLDDVGSNWKSDSEVNKKNITKNEIEEWEKIGISKHWISNWKDSGFTHKEAKMWIEAGINSFTSAEKWKKKGIAPAEVKKYQELGITTDTLYKVDELRKLGGNSLEEVKKLKEFKELGVSADDKIREYMNMGITPEILRSWNNAGVYGIVEIKQYQQNGINTPDEAKIWADAGVKNIENIEKCKKANITPEEIKNWTDAGIYAKDVFRWKELGVNDPNIAKKWKIVFGGSIDDRFDGGWVKLVDTPEDAQKLIRKGFNVNEFKATQNLQISLKDIEEWEKAGVKSGRDIADLVSSGFKNPSEYKLYEGIDKNHAIKLKEWNIKPNKLISSMSRSNRVGFVEFYFNDKKSFETAYDILKKNCDEIIIDKSLAFVDISENKNKCYLFTGKMIQRLDTQSGLVVDNSSVAQYNRAWQGADKYMYIERFQDAWIEGGVKAGVVKGNGFFSYNSQSGKRVVPRGTVLLMK